MERTISIINSFINLIKLEHHRNFLEFCNAENVVPFGLWTKKVRCCLEDGAKILNRHGRIS